MRETTFAASAALALVVLAALGGLWAARQVSAVPSPTLRASAAPSATSTAPVDTGPLVFGLPLSSACATSDALYVFSDGGGIGLFNGSAWSLVDPTLRSITGAACTSDEALGVGPAGRVVTLSERDHSIVSDTVGLTDLRAAAPLPDGVLVVGADGTVLRRASAWQPYASGLSESFGGVAALSATSAWIVGDAGAAYLLDERGWRATPTGTSAALRAVAMDTSGATAVGDGGTVISYSAGWHPLASGTTVALRAVLRQGQTLTIAGDAGTLLRIGPAGTSRVDLGTTCDLRALVVMGSDQWVIGPCGWPGGRVAPLGRPRRPLG